MDGRDANVAVVAVEGGDEGRLDDGEMRRERRAGRRDRIEGAGAYLGVPCSGGRGLVGETAGRDGVDDLGTGLLDVPGQRDDGHRSGAVGGLRGGRVLLLGEYDERDGCDDGVALERRERLGHRVLDDDGVLRRKGAGRREDHLDGGGGVGDVAGLADHLTEHVRRLVVGADDEGGRDAALGERLAKNLHHSLCGPEVLRGLDADNRRRGTVAHVLVRVSEREEQRVGCGGQGLGFRLVHLGLGLLRPSGG